MIVSIRSAYYLISLTKSTSLQGSYMFEIYPHEYTVSQNLDKNLSSASFESSVNFRQTAGDSYLIKYPTILVPHLSQVYFSKHATDGY